MRLTRATTNKARNKGRQDPRDCPSHRQWVRGHACAVCGEHPVEAAHCRKGIPDHEGPGGVGLKPHDKWVIPLCPAHHKIQHDMGEESFERSFRINMKSIAKQLWKQSPHRRKHEEKFA